MPNGQTSKIPRYYIDWFKKEKEEEYEIYKKEVLPKIIEKAEAKERKEELEWFTSLWNRKMSAPNMVPRSKIKETVLKRKFETLQENLKL